MAIYRIRIEKLDDNRSPIVQTQVEINEDNIKDLKLTKEEVLKRYFEHLYIRLKQQERGE